MIDPPRRGGRSLRAPPPSTPSLNGSAAMGENHLYARESLPQRCARDETAGRSDGASSLPSIVPTSALSDCPCSTCASGTSSAAPPSPSQASVCCIDRLNPPSKAAAPGATAER